MRVFSRQAIPPPPDLKPLPVHPLLDIEIGCGVGFHPIRYALANPERKLVAFERTHEKYLKFARRFERHGCPGNLAPIHGDAIAWLAHAASPSSVQKIFILYPNPNPKAAQKNLRWAFAPAAQLLHEILVPGGEIVIRSNKEFYIEELKNNWPALGLAIKNLALLSPAEPPLTHFEKKYFARGESCWEIVFTRS